LSERQKLSKPPKERKGGIRMSAGRKNKSEKQP
jgi:hypothetical protein